MMKNIPNFVEVILRSINDKYKAILKDNLVGIYLHGSIVFNCFNPEKSDIDFIVVVNDELANDTQHSLIKVLLDMNEFAPKKGFEMSVVLKKYCLNFEHPTPFELHFSNDWIERYQNDPNSVCNQIYKIDSDLAAHFTIIKNCGEVLNGLPINEVFGEVKKEYYIDSIYQDIVNAKTEILNNPTYMILNLCRVLAYLKDNEILSKEQGGLWGLANLDEKYHLIIQNAVDNYKTNHAIMTSEVITEFAEYMLTDINHYIQAQN